MHAVNCFPAAVLMGLRGLGITPPKEVAMQLHPDAQHQALRKVLRRKAMQTQQGGGLDELEGRTLDRMIASLQDGRCVWDEVAMLVVEQFKDSADATDWPSP